jgi:hypothetical protein
MTPSSGAVPTPTATPTATATASRAPATPAAPPASLSAGSGISALPSVDLSEEALARVSASLASTAEEYDRSAAFPWKGIQTVHDAGLLRLGIAARYGAARGWVPPTASGSSSGSAAAIPPSR